MNLWYHSASYNNGQADRENRLSPVDATRTETPLNVPNGNIVSKLRIKIGKKHHKITHWKKSISKLISQAYDLRFRLCCWLSTILSHFRVILQCCLNVSFLFSFICGSNSLTSSTYLRLNKCYPFCFRTFSEH